MPSHIPTTTARLPFGYHVRYAAGYSCCAAVHAPPFIHTRSCGCTRCRFAVTPPASVTWFRITVLRLDYVLVAVATVVHILGYTCGLPFSPRTHGSAPHTRGLSSALPFYSPHRLRCIFFTTTHWFVCRLQFHTLLPSPLRSAGCYLPFSRCTVVTTFAVTIRFAVGYVLHGCFAVVRGCLHVYAHRTRGLPHVLAHRHVTFTVVHLTVLPIYGYTQFTHFGCIPLQLLHTARIYHLGSLHCGSFTPTRSLRLHTPLPTAFSPLRLVAVAHPVAVTYCILPYVYYGCWVQFGSARLRVTLHRTLLRTRFATFAATTRWITHRTTTVRSARLVWFYYLDGWLRFLHCTFPPVPAFHGCAGLIHTACALLRLLLRTPFAVCCRTRTVGCTRSFVLYLCAVLTHRAAFCGCCHTCGYGSLQHAHYTVRTVRARFGSRVLVGLRLDSVTFDYCGYGLPHFVLRSVLLPRFPLPSHALGSLRVPFLVVPRHTFLHVLQFVITFGCILRLGSAFTRSGCVYAVTFWLVYTARIRSSTLHSCAVTTYAGYATRLLVLVYRSGLHVRSFAFALPHIWVYCGSALLRLRTACCFTTAFTFYAFTGSVRCHFTRLRHAWDTFLPGLRVCATFLPTPLPVSRITAVAHLTPYHLRLRLPGLPHVVYCYRLPRLLVPILFTTG